MSELPKHEIEESIGHEDRGTTIVEVEDLNVYSEENALPLIEIIGRLRAALDSIPEEFRSAAFLNIGASGDYASARANITFTRPETDQELADRRRWLNGLTQEQEERDRHEFKRLTRKYG